MIYQIFIVIKRSLRLLWKLPEHEEKNDKKEYEELGSIPKYMNERVLDQANWYDSRAFRNKSTYMVLSLVAIATAAAIPMAVALGGPEELSAVLGGIVSVAAASLAVLKSQENWLHYRSTAEQLKKERYFYDRNSGPYSPKLLKDQGRNRDEELVERVEDLISEEHGAWRQRREGRSG